MVTRRRFRVFVCERADLRKQIRLGGRGSFGFGFDDGRGNGFAWGHHAARSARACSFPDLVVVDFHGRASDVDHGRIHLERARLGL